MPSSGHEDVVLEGHRELTESLLNILFLAVTQNGIKKTQGEGECSLGFLFTLCLWSYLLHSIF